MFCFERPLYVFILIYCLLFSPPDLHADWSWSFPFNSAEQPKPSESATRSRTDAAEPTESRPEKPLKAPTPVPAVKSLQPAVTGPAEASAVIIRSQPFTPDTPRVLAPFKAALKFGSTVIKEDTVWSGAIQVDGMVTIAAEATLTISAGTVVRFGSNSGILVLGRIAAKGSAESPVTFSSLYLEPASNDWYGIVLTGTGKRNVFENVIIHGAETAIYLRFATIEAKKIRIDSSSTAIRLVDSIGSFKDAAVSGCATAFSTLKSEADLESVFLEKGKIGLSVLSSAFAADKLKISAFTEAAFTADKSQLKLTAALFSANLTGARINACEGSISNSTFIANIETGVNLSGSSLKFTANLVTGNRVGLQLEDNLPAVWGNSVHGNMNYNLLYLGEEKMYIGGNWFGKMNAASMDKSLFSRRPGAVLVVPLLASDPLTVSEEDL